VYSNLDHIYFPNKFSVILHVSLIMLIYCTYKSSVIQLINSTELQCTVNSGVNDVQQQNRYEDTWLNYFSLNFIKYLAYTAGAEYCHHACKLYFDSIKWQF
jgi:uncharacterized membrane protein